MDAVAKVRQPLKHGNSKFTLRRQEFKKAEDVKLITHFAQWLSDLTDMNIQPDSFPEDLLNGIALCKVMMRIDGSGVTRYHPVKNQAGMMETFRARENVAAFQSACRRLDLPTSFGTDELEAGDLGTIASALVYVAHAAAMRNVGVKELDDVLKQRIGIVVKEKQEEREEAAEAAKGGVADAEPSTNTPAEALVNSQVVASEKTAEPEEASGAVSAAVAESVEEVDEEPSRGEDLSFVGFSFAYIKGLFPMESAGDLSVAKVATDLLAPKIAASKHPEAPWSEVVYHTTEAKSDCSLNADIVVCYDPEMKWKDLIAALETSNSSSNLFAFGGTTTLWLEVLSMAPPKSSGEYELQVKHVIERVGRVELVISPWDKPSIATKSPQVWKVCCAVMCKAPIFASFLPRDQETFLEAVTSGTVGSRTFQKVFYDVNVERAVSVDPDQILRVLRILKNEIGATRVNDAFVIPIKNWIMESLKVGSEKTDLPPQKRSNVFMTQGAFYQCLGQPDEARKYFQKVLQVQTEAAQNKETPGIATALSNMASTLRELGEFKEAEETCERALKIRIACFGEGHPAVTVSRAWLGDILLASGEFKRALPILQRALEDQQKNKNATDMEISSALNNLASALRETGQMDEARKHFEEVLTRVERSSGVDHPLYGAALNNCALTLEAQKDFSAALKMHEKSLALRTRALGQEHPDVALSMHNLGICLLREDKVKNLDQAKELGKKALAIWERTLGPKHPTVAEARKDWGDLIK